MQNENSGPTLDRGGHYLGLKFDEGWWFVQVLGTAFQEVKPWTLLNESGDRDVIASDDVGERDEFRDSQGRLLLEPNDSERGTINQLLFGVAPSRVQLFPYFGRNQNVGLEDSIQPGENEVWVDGFSSPYNNPSRQSEVYYINDMSRLKISAYNPMDEPVEAKVSIAVNKIQYATVSDVNVMKAMLQNQIPVHKHMMGLGVTSANQLKMPSWLRSSFGEHIKDTEEILDEGDTSQASNTVQQLQTATNTELSRISGGGN